MPGAPRTPTAPAGTASVTAQWVPPASASRCYPPRRATPRSAWPVGQRRHGRLEEPYDIDAFSLFLGAGAWALETLPYCGTELDTELAVYGDNGELLGSNLDGPGTFFAQLPSLVLDQPMAVRFEVWGYGASTGDYLVRVLPAQQPPLSRWVHLGGKATNPCRTDPAESARRRASRSARAGAD